MRRKILITGGAGFIGSHLVKALANQNGWDIVILDALIEQVHPKGSWKKPANITFFHGNICDREIVAKALVGVEYIVHLASETGVGQSAYEISRYVNANEHGTAVLLEEISKNANQIKSFVLASSRAVYGEGRYLCDKCGPVFPLGRPVVELKLGNWEPLCPLCFKNIEMQASWEDQPLSPSSVYAITKHNQEQLSILFSKTFSVPSTILRFQNVYGPGQSLSNPYTGILSLFSTRIRCGNPVYIYEDGKEQRDFVFVEDVIQSILLGLENQQSFGEIYNIGSGKGTSVFEVATILAEKLGKKIPIEITGQFRVGDIRHAVANISKAKKLLGFKPNYSVDSGLKQFAIWVYTQALPIDKYQSMEKEMKLKGVMG